MRKARGGSYAAGWPRYYAPPFLFFGLWFRFRLCFFNFYYFHFSFLFLSSIVEERKRGEKLGRLVALSGSPLWWKRARGGNHLAGWPHS